MTENEAPEPAVTDAAELERLNDENKTRLQALFRQGMQIDPASVLSLRIDALAEMALGDGPRLIEFKLRVQRQLAQALRELESQVRQAQLAAAAQATPGQVEQLARVNGLLGPGGHPLHG